MRRPVAVRGRFGIPAGMAVVLCLAAAAAEPTAPQLEVSHSVLTPLERRPASFFGKSVAAHGGTVVVGAVRDGPPDVAAKQPGSVFVFERDGTELREAERLDPSDARDDQGFGDAVAIHRDTLVVGSTGWGEPDFDDPGHATGQVYVYRRRDGVFTEEAILSRTPAYRYALLGAEVAASEDTVAASVDAADYLTNPARGAVLVWVRDGGAWRLEQEIGPPAGTRERAEFGSDFALDGDRIAAAGLLDVPERRRAVYTFTRTAGVWALEQQVVPAEIVADEEYGSDVALRGNRMIVGAHYYTGSRGRQGRAYVFEFRDGRWEETAQLEDPVPGGGDLLGEGVALAGRTVLLWSSNGADKMGTAHLFLEVAGAWQHVQELVPANPTFRFGTSAALSGSDVFVGAPNADPTIAELQPRGRVERFSVRSPSPPEFTGTPGSEPQHPAAGLPATFTAPVASPLDVPVDVVWDFGDGTAPSTGTQVAHAFAAPGLYRVVVVADDGLFGATSRTFHVSVGTPGAVPLDVTKMRLELDLPEFAGDVAAVAASFRAQEATTLAGDTIAWRIAGIEGTATLDARERSPPDGPRVRVRARSRGRKRGEPVPAGTKVVVRVTIRGYLRDEARLGGIDEFRGNHDRSDPATADVALALGGRAYEALAIPGTYSARAYGIGRFRTAARAHVTSR